MAILQYKKGFKSKVVYSQISKARTKSCESLLCPDSRNRKSSGKDRMPLVIDFHPALSGLSKIIDKSSVIRYGKGQREIPGEHLYSHFFSKEHE